tara:strand:+ start:43 stop:150 length:108 start_codon:yes stop_codon:yes gene_type:complete
MDEQHQRASSHLGNVDARAVGIHIVAHQSRRHQVI